MIQGCGFRVVLQSGLREHNGKWPAEWVEIRGREPSARSGAGSRAGSERHWHRHSLCPLLLWSGLSALSMLAAVQFGAGDIGIHGDDVIAFSLPCALAPVTAFCFQLRLGKNFFCFIVSQERVLVQALYS